MEKARRPSVANPHFGLLRGSTPTQGAEAEQDTATMKCISLKQPYAELVVTGRKPIELRNWTTNYRGRVLIHASGRANREACARLGMDSDKLATGAIVGTAVISGVKRYSGADEVLGDQRLHHVAQGDLLRVGYGLLIRDPVKFSKPISMKGRLRLFEVKVQQVAAAQQS